MNKVRLISRYNDNFHANWSRGVSMHFRIKISTLPDDGNTRILLLTDKKVPSKNPEQVKRKVFSLDVHQRPDSVQIFAMFELGWAIFKFLMEVKLQKGDIRLKFNSVNLLQTWSSWKRTEQLEVFFRVNWLENQSFFTIYRGNDISTGVNILAVEKRIKNRHIKTHKLKFWVFKNKMRNSQSCVRSATI